MATENELMFRAVIDRLKEEGLLLRNSGSHSLKTVKEVFKNELRNSTSAMRDEFDAADNSAEKNADRVASALEGLSTSGSLSRNVEAPESKSGSLDDVEKQREMNDWRENQIDLLSQIVVNTQLTANALTQNNRAGKPKAEPKGKGGLLKGALSGLGGGIGLAATGIGAGVLLGGAGVALVVESVTRLNKSFDDLAVGIGMLNELDIDPEKFEVLGTAIGNLASGVGIGGAIGLRILSGAAFDDLSSGIDKLNNLEYKPEGIESLGLTLAALKENTGILSSFGVGMLADVDFGAIAKGIQDLNDLSVDEDNLRSVGEGMNALIEPLSASDLGEASSLEAAGKAIGGAFSTSVAALNDIKVGKDFTDKMSIIGKGINALMEPISISDLGEAAVLSNFAGNSGFITGAIDDLNKVDAGEWSKNAALIGGGFASLLKGTENTKGARGLEMIDDNIIPLTDALKHWNDTVDATLAQDFVDNATTLGGGFKALLTGTQNLFGTTGLQAIDDNIAPVADAVKSFVDTIDDKTAKSFGASGVLIGAGFTAILNGTDDLFGVKGFASLTTTILPFAGAVEKLDTVGANLKLNNFKQISLAIKEMRSLAEELSDIDFSDVDDGSLAIRDIADRAIDMQTLIKGIGQGGERDFNTLGLVGLGNSIDFGDGLLKAPLELDAVLTKVQKIQDAIKGVSSLQTNSEQMQMQQKENTQMGSEGASNIVVAPTDASSVVTNNSNTAAIIDQNLPTQDHNDRSWVG